MNQALSFGALGTGGVLLISAITHTPLGDVLRGKIQPVSHTGQNLAGGLSVGMPAGSAGSAAGMAGDRNYLESQGLSKTAAAGIVGNLWQESSGDPNAPGGGLAQWIGSRWNALLAFSAQHGLDPHANATQLQYLVTELRGSYPQLVGQLNTAATPADAAVLFSNTYERPGNPQLGNRIRYAQQAYAA